MKGMSLFMIMSGVMIFATSAFAQNPAEMGAGPVTYPSLFQQDINSHIGQRNATMEENEYPSFENKYSSGLINIASSLTEIPDKVVETAKDQGILVAGTVGLGKGILSGIGRTVAGIYDLTTIPISPEKKPLLEPKYKVENPEEGLKFNVLEW